MTLERYRLVMNLIEEIDLFSYRGAFQEMEESRETINQINEMKKQIREILLDEVRKIN